jgi:hypothetical protein
MTYSECEKLAEWMNNKFPGWYQWSTAQPFTWDKLLRIYFKYTITK